MKTGKKDYPMQKYMQIVTKKNIKHTVKNTLKILKREQKENSI